MGFFGKIKKKLVGKSNKSTAFTESKDYEQKSKKKKKEKSSIFSSSKKRDYSKPSVTPIPPPKKKTSGKFSQKEKKVASLERPSSPNSTASPPLFEKLESENSLKNNISKIYSKNSRSNFAHRSLIDLDSSFEEEDNVKVNGVKNNDFGGIVEFHQQQHVAHPVQRQYEFQPYRNYQLSPNEYPSSMYGNNNPNPTQNTSNNTEGAGLPSPTESSDFCLSTDVDDDEYNKIRHTVKGSLGKSPSSASNSSKEGYGLFPNLMDRDDDGGEIQLTPMANETEEDLRAWTPSPRHGSGNNAKPNLFSFESPETSSNHNLKKSSNKKNMNMKNRKPNNNSLLTESIDSDANSSFAPLAGESLLATSIESNESFQDDSLLYPGAFTGIALADGLSPSSAEHDMSSPRNNILTSDDKILSEKASDFFDADWSQHNFNIPFDKKQQQPEEKSKLKSSSNTNSISFADNNKISPTSSSPHHDLKHRGSGHNEIPQHPRSIMKENAKESSLSRHRSTHSSPSIIMTQNHIQEGITSPSTKEKVKRKKRRYKNPSHHNNDNSGGSSDEVSNDNDWLFDEVAGALGPRGITADLESLGGRSQKSNRSRTSISGKSHRSHRSTKSHKSTSSRRSRRHHHHHPSGESVGSRNSRNSHISHRSSRSVRSHLSNMTEASRSVANDLLRLEMQLAMVGSTEKSASGSVGGNSRASYDRSGAASVSGTSIGATSRSSRKSNSGSHRSSSAASRRSKITIVAPPGKLGIILANKFDSKGTVISGVRSSSVLADKLHPGDRIIAVDGEDVSRMTVAEITTIMARKNDFERTLTILTSPKSSSSSNQIHSPISLDGDQQHHRMLENGSNFNSVPSVFVRN